MSDKPRAVKTPQQRAQEQVAVLERRLTKLKKAKAALESQSLDLTLEIDTVVKRLEYARSNPDLPKKEPRPT